jgi:hypothetical protein
MAASIWTDTAYKAYPPRLLWGKAWGAVAQKSGVLYFKFSSSGTVWPDDSRAVVAYTIPPGISVKSATVVLRSGELVLITGPSILAVSNTMNGASGSWTPL